MTGERPGDAATPAAPLPARRRPWICLIYHDVTTGAEWRSPGKRYFSVPAGAFGRQLDLIREMGLRGSSIAEAMAGRQDAVAISFDDGDLGQAVRAFPALASRNMTATFFVTTSWVGTPDYASWDQLREMRAAGMSIQSHTHSHPFLSELDEPRLREELRRSREILDTQLGQRTNEIAFPGGDAPRADLAHVLLEEGYDVVSTSRWGRNTPWVGPRPAYIRRCTVRGEPADADFQRIVRGDGWLGFQRQARERLLALIRSSLGPTRYARWRKRVLGAAPQAT